MSGPLAAAHWHWRHTFINLSYFLISVATCGHCLARSIVLNVFRKSHPPHIPWPWPPPAPVSLLCLVSQGSNEHCKHIDSRIRCHHSSKLVGINPVARKVSITEHNDKRLICWFLAHLRNSQPCCIQGVISWPAELGVCMHCLKKTRDSRQVTLTILNSSVNCVQCSIPWVQSSFRGGRLPD